LGTPRVRSMVANFVAKVENRTTLKISRKLTFRPLCCCVAFQRCYGGLTGKKYPGNPMKSYRSRELLRVAGEVTDWQGHSPEALKAMRTTLSDLANSVLRQSTTKCRLLHSRLAGADRLRVFERCRSQEFC